MKISWSLCLVTGLVTGLMLGSYLSHPDRQPVLRGYKIDLPLLSRPPSMEQVQSADVPALPDISDSITRWNDPEPPQRPQLNLNLPDIDWGATEWQEHGSPYPDFFRSGRGSDSRMNLSGRLHWDESEAAESLPLTETILGAEVELQLRLP